MAQYINREKLLKRMEGYCEANCGCKPYEDALCSSCGLGDAIYMVEEQCIVNSRNMRGRKDATMALSKMEKTTRWIPVTDEEHIPNTDHGVVGYFGGGAFNQLRWYDFITTLSDGKIVGESTERDVINEHCIAVYKLPEPPKEG